MAKKTKRAKVEPIKDRAEFDIELDGISTNLLKLDAIKLDLEAKITALREAASAEIKELETAIGLALARSEKFATINRATLIPDGKKESQTTLTLFGFRWGNKSLVTVENWDWNDVVTAIQAKIETIKDQIHDADADKLGALVEELAKWDQLIVTKTEVAKDQVKSDLTDEERASIGTKINQKECFWVEPKREKSNPLTTAPTTEPQQAAA